jgi:hypothetical protein
MLDHGSPRLGVEKCTRELYSFRGLRANLTVILDLFSLGFDRPIIMGVMLTAAVLQAGGRACPEQSRRDLARTGNASIMLHARSLARLNWAGLRDDALGEGWMPELIGQERRMFRLPARFG